MCEKMFSKTSLSYYAITLGREFFFIVAESKIRRIEEMVVGEGINLKIQYFWHIGHVLEEMVKPLFQ